MADKTNNQLAQERAAAEAAKVRKARGAHLLSSDALAGAAYFEDRTGRLWKVKVFTLGDSITSTSAYAEALYALASYQIDATQAAIVRTRAITLFLQSPAPSLWIRLRRFRGLPDYTPFHVARYFPAADFEALRNMIFKSNTGDGFETYMEKAIKAAEELKKKIEMELKTMTMT